jgi:hypothetical protein
MLAISGKLSNQELTNHVVNTQEGGSLETKV